jgi:hypothetical protein
MDIIMYALHSMSIDILVFVSCVLGLTHVGEKSKKQQGCSQLKVIFINFEHPQLRHLHEVIIDKTQG